MKSKDFTLYFADKTDNDRDTGIHSTRKFGVNLGRGGGKSRDDINQTGRWKGHDRQ